MSGILISSYIQLLYCMQIGIASDCFVIIKLKCRFQLQPYSFWDRADIRLVSLDQVTYVELTLWQLFHIIRALPVEHSMLTF